jgi:hypothetical protein
MKEISADNLLSYELGGGDLGTEHKFSGFAAHIGDKPIGFAQMASYIRSCCKTVAVMTQLQQNPTGDETVITRLPLLPDWAELWFLVSKEFSTAMIGIADQVNGGTQTLEVAPRNAVRMAPQTEEDSGLQSEEDSASRSTFYTAAFLEHLLRVAKPDIIREAMACYRNLAHGSLEFG